MQLSEPGRSEDLIFEPWVVKVGPDIWNDSPMKANDMAVQPMKDIQDIKATYISDITLETRQFGDFPTSEL